MASLTASFVMVAALLVTDHTLCFVTCSLLCRPLTRRILAGCTPQFSRPAGRPTGT